jgi:hypothetical protein
MQEPLAAPRRTVIDASTLSNDGTVAITGAVPDRRGGRVAYSCPRPAATGRRCGFATSIPGATAGADHFMQAHERGLVLQQHRLLLHPLSERE